MLVDAVIFNDELDLLRLRIDLLGAHVDRFLVAESRRTFSGRDKPLHLSENLHLFADVADRLDVVEYDLPATVESTWDRERLSRDALMSPLRDLAPDGTVLLCDVDEFPSPEQADAAREVREMSSIPLTTYFRRANWRVEYDTPLLVTRAVPVASLGESLAELRWERRPEIPRLHGETGAHFSYLGYTARDLAAKYGDFSHDELDFAEASSTRLLALADAMAVDHLGRVGERGRGLLTLEPRESWGYLQQALFKRRPEAFDLRARLPPRPLRRASATLIDRVVNDRSPEHARLLGRRPTPRLLADRTARAVLADTARRDWIDVRSWVGARRRGLRRRGSR